MKKCCMCKTFKETDNFHKDSSRGDGLNPTCKECVTTYKKRKKDHYDAYRKEWKKHNPEYQREYRAAHREDLNRQANEWEKLKKSTDVNFKLRRLLRDRLRKALKSGYKSGSAVKDLGCTVEFLKKHLESKFEPGMTWENHGEWHIDHIVPLSFFNLSDREQLLTACNYMNLQPLWAHKNYAKSDKVG